EAIASVVQQLGMREFMQLVWTRMQRPESVRWQELLDAARSGSLNTGMLPSYAGPRLPEFVSELGTSAAKVVAITTYPDTFLVVSPIAYTTLMDIASEGPVKVDSLASRRTIPAADVRAACNE